MRLRRQFAEQLDAFDLTIDRFRLMEILYREGPITTEEFCKRRRCRRQSLEVLLKPLEERGWVQFEVIDLNQLKSSGRSSRRGFGTCRGVGDGWDA